MKKYMANIITYCRILLSMLMMFFPVFSSWFYIIYLICGVTDMIDGAIARKTNSVSAFGSHLDTVGDSVFILSASIKIISAVYIPIWLWIWIIIIAVIKITNIISGFIRKKRFIAEHTVMNKITGFLLFLLHLTLSRIDPKYTGMAVCSIATFAAIQEGHYIRKGIEI